MTNCEIHTNDGNCCCLSIELSINQSTCVNPFDYLAEIYADSSSPFEDLIEDLEDGIAVPESENLCCPTCGDIYFLGGVQIGIALAESIGISSGGDPYECYGNVYSNVESYLKWAEGIGWTQSPGSFQVGNILPIDNNFTEIIMNFLETVYAPTNPDPLEVSSFYLLDIGIVELGSLKNNNCSSLNNFFNMIIQFKDQYETPINIFEKLGDLLDIGIVIDCPNIYSTELFLKTQEALRADKKRSYE